MEHVLTEIKNHIGWITINHPERYNSYDGETAEAITSAFKKMNCDPTVGVIVLTGKGDKAFSAGGYVGDLAEATESDIRYLFDASLDLMESIRTARQPVIAAINGYAIGGGNELVVACDLAIASEHAKLGQNGPRVGSAAVLGGTNLLSLSVGEKKAKEISFMCRRYTAQEALELGWVNQVVPHDELFAEVERWAEELMSVSPKCLEISKLSSNIWWDYMRTGYTHSLGALKQIIGSEQAREGAQAFIEKREPDFKQFLK